MIIFAILSLFISLAYLTMITTFRKHWNRAPEFIPYTPSGEKKISVVAAFRNEITNLPALINSLKDQNLDTALFEVILCDDGSTTARESWQKNTVVQHPDSDTVRLLPVKAVRKRY
jgi:cellulose synthase/poly-beta-1,6-N-acetylglucosamine synthase-like glycosyltransferase